MGEFFKNAFKDMKENAKAQHEVDKANLAAVRAESKAQWEEAKMSPKQRQALMQKERDAQIAEANKRIAAANERINFAHGNTETEVEVVEADKVEVIEA
ncbi:MAG: hypothetical protein IJF37_05325 [Lachnospiraceae bacterium]|nr:hypothetical protein [Lachnospiraceae bacterium]